MSLAMNISPLMPGEKKKGHSYLNKSAAEI